MDLNRLVRLESEAALDLLEVFSSIQGEGPRAGERHLFIRLAHCDIQCAYCDTPLCHAIPERGRIEGHAGRRDFQWISNPVKLSDLDREVRRLLAATRHRAVSFTGGEPLLHPWVIEALGPSIRDAGSGVLLETDGNLPEALERVLPSVDIVSMDWKLPSATLEPPRYEEHRRFLKLASPKELYVKAVFVEDTPEEEILMAGRTVAATRRDIPFVLQPLTPMGRMKKVPSPVRALEFAEALSLILDDVRVLPQIHRALQQL